MRLSIKWLRQYVQFRISPEDLGQRLTSVGLEVESIEHLGKVFDGFVVGEVMTIRKHPNADKLTICEVDVQRKGTSPASVLQIVCGAPNVQKGQKAAVGLIGAVVPKNQHDPEARPFVLSMVKVRGEESSGMICSEYELGLGTDANGILVLDETAKPGTPLAEYFGLNDIVFEIGVTPNRPDCLSHIGIAREAAAILRKKLTIPKLRIREEKKGNIKETISIKIENKRDCARYSARLVTGIIVGPSPEWMQTSLKAVGIRPINNVVDITNYVMIECGQPLHAFDYDRIQGKQIVVRSASEGEKFVTLDQKEHALSASTLMICDAKKPIAIAGVMGGMNSEISISTTSVLIESAYFDPASIRKTAKQLGISSDAAYRFERGTDPNGTLFAANRAAELMKELANGKIHKGAVDEYPRKINERRIDVRIVQVNRVLGTALVASDVKKYLPPIGIRVVENSKGRLKCIAPTFRPDLEQEIDIVEEIARIHGYANIADKMVSAIDFSGMTTSPDEFHDIRRFLEGSGFSEVVTNSLVDVRTAQMFSDRVVRIMNPISQDLSAMRPSSVCSMLQTVSHNTNYGTKDLRLFELGRTYETVRKEEEGHPVPGYAEKKVLALCLSGRREQRGWDSSEKGVDIYDMKGVVESLLNKILLDKFHFICYDSHSALTEQTIAIEKNGTYVGFVGKVKAELLRTFSIENDVYVSELNVQDLVQSDEGARSYSPSSKFPIVTRDLAFVVERNILAEDLQRHIAKIGGKLLTQIVLFDIFEGKPLSENKKSLAFSLQLNSFEKTLTEEEVDSVVNGIVADIHKTFGAELRSS